MCNMNRVYGKKIDVSAEMIKEFYDKRANKYEDGEKLEIQQFYLEIIIHNTQIKVMKLKKN